MIRLYKRLLNSRRIRGMMKECWSVSWPMTIIMLFVSLIGIIDVYVAGRFGKEVQAAYGVAYQIYFVFLIIAMSLSVGTVSIVSRLSASEKKEEFYLAIKSSLFIAVLGGMIFSLIGIIFGKHIVGLLNIPPALKPYASSLVSLYFIGLLFHYMMMNTNAILRASKKIKKSLRSMGIVCISNICLNFYLSFMTPLGFRGIAVSTAISLFLGVMMNLYGLRKLLKGVSWFSAAIAKNIFNISWPAGLLQLLWQLGAMALFIIIARIPHNNIATMAAFTNGLKIESLIFLPAFAFNMANAVVVGNALGKNDNENAFYTGIMTALMGVGIITILTLLLLLNAVRVASFFSNDPIVIRETVRYIIISLCFEPIMAWGVILGGALNGAGDTKTVMKYVGFSVWFLRIPLSYILGVYFGLGALFIWWSMNISILFQSILFSRRYFNKKWIDLSKKTIAHS